MSNIKMELELRLENIFVSLNKENLNKLNDLVKLKELDIIEKEMLNKFIYMTGQVEDKLSIETLKKEFSSLYFDKVTFLNIDQELDDYIRLYIADKKNNYTSNIKIVPYIDNMVRLLKKTDVLVSRAGASTLSEIIALNIPSILIPSPYVPNNHQYINNYMMDRLAGFFFDIMIYL